MHYTVLYKGRVLGTTTLDFYQLVHGQHSGWLHPEPGAEDLLDAASIRSAALRAWQTRGDTLPDGRPLTQPEFIASRECQAISVAVAARSHLALTLHREDGSELPTREILLQDRIYWETPDEDDPDEALEEEMSAQLDAAVEHEVAVMLECKEEGSEGAMSSITDDQAFRRLLETRWLEAEESRYQVHVRLANPDDLPSELTWLAGSSE